MQLLTIIATHITEIIRAHAAEILGMKEVAEIIKAFREKNADVVEAVMDNAKFTYGQIQKILQNLLREQISIRNIELILETLANFGPQVNPWTLTEKVRKALGLQICLQYADSDKTLRAMTLSQEWTEKIVEHQNIPADGSMPMVALDPPDARRWIEAVSNAFASMQQSNINRLLSVQLRSVFLLRVQLRIKCQDLLLFPLMKLWLVEVQFHLKYLAKSRIRR